jgi:hypothetical protein
LLPLGHIARAVPLLRALENVGEPVNGDNRKNVRALCWPRQQRAAKTPAKPTRLLSPAGSTSLGKKYEGGLRTPGDQIAILSSLVARKAIFLLAFEGPDKSDVAGALRRMEIRAFLREMKGNDQKNYFARHGDNLPAEVAMAILEIPPEFSGVPKSRHDLMKTRAVLSENHIRTYW